MLDIPLFHYCDAISGRGGYPRLAARKGLPLTYLSFQKAAAFDGLEGSAERDSRPAEKGGKVAGNIAGNFTPTTDIL
jgi:hypothetical protein